MGKQIADRKQLGCSLYMTMRETHKHETAIYGIIMPRSVPT